jgi:hypothetical protein
MDSLFSFPVGLFHPLRTCRFIPTLSGCAVIRPEASRSTRPMSDPESDTRRYKYALLTGEAWQARLALLRYS